MAGAQAPGIGGPLAGASHAPLVRRLAAAPCARRLSCRASSSSGGDAGGSAAVAAAAVAEVLRHDIDYLDSRTGLDLNGTLGAVKDVHDEVVAALNPPAGEAMALELEEQIAGLQQDLAVANQQVRRSIKIRGGTAGDRAAQVERGACRWRALAGRLPSQSAS